MCFSRRCFVLFSAYKLLVFLVRRTAFAWPLLCQPQLFGINSASLSFKMWAVYFIFWRPHQGSYLGTSCSNIWRRFYSLKASSFILGFGLGIHRSSYRGFLSADSTMTQFFPSVFSWALSSRWYNGIGKKPQTAAKISSMWSSEGMCHVCVCVCMCHVCAYSEHDL